MVSLHYFFIFLLLTSSIFVILSQNPVHSVLFLIAAFCNASGILFLFNAEFLGLIFIIVYVGAIAVLFLFVVMMLNVKVFSSNNFLYSPLVFLGGFVLMLQIFLVLEKTFSNNNFAETSIAYNFDNYLDNLSSIDVLGQSLYNYYLVCFLLAGLILLVAMLGAIVLTLNFSSQRKTELSARQLSRSDNFLAFFKG
jgi:NADH-quinone oxidoreductase subunit J|tara:strand:+ start:246 stop:830 length:585 start_codon:yes stop_codon:yes gene_type:complete